MATAIDSNPFPLGFIHPVPGTPQGLLVNYPDLDVDDSCNLILVQAYSENAGRAFLGNHRLNILTGAGLMYTLMGAGDSFSLSNVVAQNVYKLSEFRVDVEFFGDGVFVTIYVR